MRRRAAIYVRISKARRTEDGELSELGVDRQEDQCRELANRLGWDVTEVYCDNDRSAFSGKPRPAYRQMLEAMRTGHINAVIGWHSDRIYVRPVELEELITIANAHDVKFAAVQVGNIDLSTASGQLVARMLGSAASYERQIKGERQAAQLRQFIMAGNPQGGGHRSFGYVDRRRTVLDPVEAPMVVEMADRLLAGQSINEIARWANSTGVPTVLKSEKGWQPGVVRAILTNPQVAGFVTYKGEIVPDVEAKWVPLLEKETWKRIDLLVAHRARTEGQPRARSSLLVGMLVCGRCGARMTSAVAQTKPGRPNRKTYKCPAPSKPGRGGKSCGLVTQTREPLDDDITERLIGRLLRPLSTATIEDVAAHQGDDTSGIAELLAAEARLRDLGVDYADGLIGRTEFLSARDRLATRIDVLQTKVVPARVTAPTGDLQKLVDWWISAPLGLQRTLITQMVESIQINPYNTSRAGKYDRDRVKVNWR